MIVPRSLELKLNRVGEHINTLEQAIDAFLIEEPYAVRRELVGNGSEHVFYWVRYTEPPDSFSLISGDAIHNLRSSLDHLAVELAIAGARKRKVMMSEKDIRHIQFPIATSDTSFNDQLDSKRLLNVDSAAQDEIRMLQPYKLSPHNPELSPLFQVSSLDNTDKHRQLIITPLAPSVKCVNWPHELQGVALARPNLPVSWTTNAEIGRFVFPASYSEVDVPVEYSWGFTLVAGVNAPAWDIRYMLKNYMDVVKTMVIKPLVDKYLV